MGGREGGREGGWEGGREGEWVGIIGNDYGDVGEHVRSST